MRLYCEIVSQDLLPALRALVTISLIDKHRLTQQQVAKKLFITQGAVSQYYRKLRGKASSIEKDMKAVEEIEALSAKLASEGEINYETLAENILDICNSIKERGMVYAPGKDFINIKKEIM